MSIPRSGLLLVVFLVSLLFWVVWYLPARVLIARLPALQPGGASLQLTAAEGTLWHGQSHWQWRDQQGRLGWDVRFHGLTPGLDLRIDGDGLKLAGWLAPGRHSFELSGWRIELPLSLALAAAPGVAADGSISGQLETLVYQTGRIQDLKGRLSWPGGAGRWQRQSATLPAMQAALGMEGGTAVALLSNQQQQLLARVSLDEQLLGKVEIYRRLAQDMHLSEGKGSSADVIFRASQPLTEWLP